MQRFRGEFQAVHCKLNDSSRPTSSTNKLQDVLNVLLLTAQLFPFLFDRTLECRIWSRGHNVEILTAQILFYDCRNPFVTARHTKKSCYGRSELRV